MNEYHFEKYTQKVLRKYEYVYDKYEYVYEYLYDKYEYMNVCMGALMSLSRKL